MVPTISLFNVKVNIRKITTLKPSCAPVIEMKCKTSRSIILNDGTLKSFSKMTRPLDGIVQAR